MNGRIEVYDSKQALVEAVATQIQRHLGRAIAVRRAASLAFSGGSTPKNIYELLGTQKFRDRIEWKRVHCFLGDERSVPQFNPESNFRMISEALLQHIEIPAKNVHRVKTEKPPHEAAELYEEEMRSLFQVKDGEFPEFDVLLLGLGEDGHTASLFPGTDALEVTDRFVTAVVADHVKIPRVSFTMPLINHAAEIIFVVSGKGKASILKSILTDETPRYPAQMVKPIKGRLTWMTDREAVSQLEGVH